MALPIVTQSEMIENLSERTGHTKSDCRVFLAAIQDEVVDALEAGSRVKVAGVQIEPKLKKATKKRMGRNPRTGEEVQIAAKPASVVIKARVLATLKNGVSLPSPKKLSNLS